MNDDEMADDSVRRLREPGSAHCVCGCPSGDHYALEHWSGCSNDGCHCDGYVACGSFEEFCDECQPHAVDPWRGIEAPSDY